jgi:ABC-type oligopeptide transport system substrate-binding subunit
VTRRIFLLYILCSLATFHTSHAEPISVSVALPAPANLDPVAVGRDDSGSRDLIENLFVGLTRYDPSTNSVQKALAQDWSVSNDGLTWTFTLRKDISWVALVNGSLTALRPVVASDFVYALRRACAPTSPRPATHTVYILDGCRNIATADPASVNDAFMTRELQVTAINDLTLRIRLLFPTPNFAVLLAQPEFRPVPHEALEKGGDWTKLGTIATDGPYAIVAEKPGQALTLARNTFWPLPVTGNVDQVEVIYLSPVALALTEANVDYVRLPIADALPIRMSNPDSILLGPGVDSQITLLGFSAELPGVFNEAFRRALSAAIDRTALLNAPLPNSVIPISRLIPPGVVGSPNDPPDNRSFSVDVARNSLAASGFGPCHPPEQLNFAILDTPEMNTLAGDLIATWGAALGCPASLFHIQKLAPADLDNVVHANIDANAASRAHLWLYAWSSDYNDANGWISDSIHCLYGYLRTGAKCGNAETIMDQAFLEPDPGKRAAAYAQAGDLLFGPGGTFPVVPLYIRLTAIGHSARITGLSLSGASRFDEWMIK